MHPCLFSISHQQWSTLAVDAPTTGYLFAALVWEAAFQLDAARGPWTIAAGIYRVASRDGAWAETIVHERDQHWDLPYHQWLGGVRPDVPRRKARGRRPRTMKLNGQLVTEHGKAVAAYLHADELLLGLLRRMEDEAPNLGWVARAILAHRFGEAQPVCAASAGLREALASDPVRWRRLVAAVADHRSPTGRAPSSIPRSVVPQRRKIDPGVVRGRKGPKVVVGVSGVTLLSRLNKVKTAPQVAALDHALWVFLSVARLVRAGDRNSRCWSAGFRAWFRRVVN